MEQLLFCLNTKSPTVPRHLFSRRPSYCNPLVRRRDRLGVLAHHRNSSHWRRRVQEDRSWYQYSRDREESQSIHNKIQCTTIQLKITCNRPSDHHKPSHSILKSSNLYMTTYFLQSASVTISELASKSIMNREKSIFYYGNSVDSFDVCKIKQRTLPFDSDN